MHGYPLSTQSVAIGLASTASVAVGAYTQCVRLIATSACHVSFDGAATASDMYLAPNREEYFVIKPGQQIAVIQDSAAGSLYVTEMTR